MAQESFREHPATHHPVYIGVMRHVGEMFDEIRASVTTYGISNCLRAALLQPLSSPALKQVCSYGSLRSESQTLPDFPLIVNLRRKRTLLVGPSTNKLF